MPNPWMLGPNLLGLICQSVPPGSTILELGSGEGTAVLSAHYHMVSIEHDPTFLNKYPSRYIYAPLRDGWYCRPMIEVQLPDGYDALIIDGPPGELRGGILTHLDLFDLSVPIFIDDINRRVEREVFETLTIQLGRPSRTGSEDDGRNFGIIYAAERIYHQRTYCRADPSPD